MGYQSAYAKARFGVDVANEEIQERRELEEAIRAREKEEGRKALIGTLAKTVGSVAFGPIGGFVGGTIGKLGTDLAMKSEDVKVSGGKFKKYEAGEINRELDDYDKESNISNAIGVATDALTSFMLAGGIEGMKETLEAGGNFGEFASTWGSGEDAKMSLAKWMGMSGEEKLAGGIGNIGYLEYILGINKPIGNAITEKSTSRFLPVNQRFSMREATY